MKRTGYEERNIMAKSMTAFGRSIGTAGGKEITVELRSVNSRYLDCTVKMARVYSFLEEKARSYLGEKGISRGKIDLYVGVNVIENAAASVSLDRAYLDSYLAALRELRDGYRLRDDLSVMQVARNPAIFTERHDSESEEEAWEELRPFLDEAIDRFLSMREREGENLKKDLLGKKEEFALLAGKVEERAARYVTDYREKLTQRLRTVLEEYSVELDPQRVLTECAIYADKTAVDEELVRLRSHCKAFEEIFRKDEPVGRKLDFLLQEMNRETNTIGSKCCDAETAAIVVDMKCLLEKIREQVQNLE